MGIIKDYLFPFGDLSKATKIINNKIEKLQKSSSKNPYQYEFASNNESIDEKVLTDILKDTIDNKKILEDKSKSSLIAITIASTLIFNVIKFMQDSNDSFFATLLLAVFSFLSLVYMVMAGVLSLYSISEINQVSILFPDDHLQENKQKYIQIADNVENNYLHNLKRNNFMTTSYKCMITSISMLIVIFIISAIVSFQQYEKDIELRTIQNEITAINNQINQITVDNKEGRDETIDVLKKIIVIMDNDKDNEDKVNDTLKAINQLISDASLYSDQHCIEIKKILNDISEKLEKYK